MGKVDIDCDNEVEDGCSKSTEEALRKLRQRAYEQMHQHGLGDLANEKHFFLISAKYKNAVVRPKFDFERLKYSLQTSISDEARCRQVELLFAKNARDLAHSRAEECRALVSSYVLAAASSGAIPVPGVSVAGDVAIVVAACRQFQYTFFLEDSQLGAPEFAKIAMYLSAKVAASIPLFFGVTCAASAAADGMIWIPLAGIPISVAVGSSVSAVGTHLTLHSIINSLERVTQAVYEAMMHCRSGSLTRDMDQVRSLIDELFPVDVRMNLDLCAS